MAGDEHPMADKDDARRSRKLAHAKVAVDIKLNTSKITSKINAASDSNRSNSRRGSASNRNGSSSGTVSQRDGPVFPQESYRMSRKERLADAKTRAKFIKAAMPSSYPTTCLEALRTLSPPSRDGSLSPSLIKLKPWEGPYPWEMTIPPPPKISPRSMDAKMPAAVLVREAAKRAALEKAARAKARAEELARKKMAERLRAIEIEEAGRAAAAEVRRGEPTSVAKLQELQEACTARREELLHALKEIEHRKRESLLRRIGEAMLERGIATHALMAEWAAGTTEEGLLTKQEFRQALRMTLSLKPSDDQIDDFFKMAAHWPFKNDDSFKNKGPGAISLAEIKPALRQVHGYARSEKDKELRWSFEAEACARQAQAYQDCQASAAKWGHLQRLMDELRSHPSLRVSIGYFIEQQKVALAPSPAESPTPVASRLASPDGRSSPAGAFSSPTPSPTPGAEGGVGTAAGSAEGPAEARQRAAVGHVATVGLSPTGTWPSKAPNLKLLLQEWGSDGMGFVSREAFVRKLSALKNEGELQIPGEPNEVKEVLMALFDDLLKEGCEVEVERGRSAASEVGPRLDLEKAFSLMMVEVEAQRGKEKKLMAALEKARENALTMQAQCAADAAKRAKETEIEARERAMALKNLREPQGTSGNTSSELAALNSSLRALTGPSAPSELAALNSSVISRPGPRRPTLDNLEATRPRRPTLDNSKAMVMA